MNWVLMVLETDNATSLVDEFQHVQNPRGASESPQTSRVIVFIQRFTFNCSIVV